MAVTSRYDGRRSVWWMPQPVKLPFAFYPKMDYGEISEHTSAAALVGWWYLEPVETSEEGRVES